MVELLLSLSMAGVQFESQSCLMDGLQGWYKEDKIVVCESVNDLDLTIKHEAIHFIQEKCECNLLTDDELTTRTRNNLDSGEVLFVLLSYDDTHGELEARLLSQLPPENIIDLIKTYTF